ncbi:MAG: hypothetical protein AAGG02_07275 [Cyanobacteria bacterium P01_H01_bin.15]
MSSQYPGLRIGDVNDRTDITTFGQSPQATASLVFTTGWMQPAANDATYNLVMAVGDNPTRPPRFCRRPGPTCPFSVQIFEEDGTLTWIDHYGDSNGGVPNLPRLLENWQWQDVGSAYNVSIRGSLIELQRSRYSTAPITPIPLARNAIRSSPRIRPTDDQLKYGPFGYPQLYPTNGESRRAPSRVAPSRDWGYDVGLLSQQPDLFSSQFVLDAGENPNEFYREVEQDDPWVQTLLCSKLIIPGVGQSTNAVDDNLRPTDYCTQKTGG